MPACATLKPKPRFTSRATSGHWSDELPTQAIDDTSTPLGTQHNPHNPRRRVKNTTRSNTKQNACGTLSFVTNCAPRPPPLGTLKKKSNKNHHTFHHYIPAHHSGRVAHLHLSSQRLAYLIVSTIAISRGHPTTNHDHYQIMHHGGDGADRWPATCMAVRGFTDWK